MIIRSKTPLRLGLAGGGTDVMPFLKKYGGCVLNVTINMYSYCTIKPTEDGKITFIAPDMNQTLSFDAQPNLPVDKDKLPLHCGIYNRIVKDFNGGMPLSFTMVTYSEAPSGSGLGTSSTMVVTILKAFQEWLSLPLGQYDIANLAYQIERHDLKFKGGMQDQYAATFGGLNYIEFFDEDHVVVNPLRLKSWLKNEIESSLIMFYTGLSHDSSKIIEEQSKALDNKKSLDAMFEIKNQTRKMKEAVLKADMGMMAECLIANWEAKKKTSAVISNPKIEEVYNYAIENGAKACKISGAGGGGFMMILCDPCKRFSLIQALNKLGFGLVKTVDFVDSGSKSWRQYED